MASAIELRGLTRRFDGFTAVDGLDLKVEEGEIFGLLGPNGSGKTTTIKMICGLLSPSRGTARVMDMDPGRRGAEIRGILGYMPQQFSLYDDLTARENLLFLGGLYGLNRAASRERAAELMSEFALHDVAERLAVTLSAGWKRRLALAAALVHRPRLLLLDEPTSGVDPIARRQFWEILHKLADDGATILITTHHLDEAEFCHRVAIMRQGMLLACDSPSVLRRGLQGQLWEISTAAWADVYKQLPPIYERYLQGRNLRIWLDHGQDEEALRAALPDNARFTRVDPSLEDVFLRLAQGRRDKPMAR